MDEKVSPLEEELRLLRLLEERLQLQTGPVCMAVRQVLNELKTWRKGREPFSGVDPFALGKLTVTPVGEFRGDPMFRVTGPRGGVVWEGVVCAPRAWGAVPLSQADVEAALREEPAVAKRLGA